MYGKGIGDDTDATQTSEGYRNETNESMGSIVSSENDLAHDLQRRERPTTKSNTQSGTAILIQ